MTMYNIISASVGRFVAQKSIIQLFLVFLTSFTHPTEFLLLTLFSIFWPFVYSTMNKQCLEILSCVCGYCIYGLFFVLPLTLKYF